MYFAGGSTGGREGYTVMQRFPDDYDGVIANSPALNFSGVRLIGVKVGQAEYATPGGFIPPLLLDHVYRRTLAVCDRLDGAADGIVSDVAACREHEAEIVDSLRCAGHTFPRDAMRQRAATRYVDGAARWFVAAVQARLECRRLSRLQRFSGHVFRGFSWASGTRRNGSRRRDSSPTVTCLRRATAMCVYFAATTTRLRLAEVSTRNVPANIARN